VLHISNYNEPVLISSPINYDQNNIEYNKFIKEKSNINIATKISTITEYDLVQVTIQEGNQKEILNTFITDNFIDLIIIGNKDINKKSDFLDHKNILLNVIDIPLLIIPDLQIFQPLKVLNFLTTHTEKDLDHIIQLSNLFSDSLLKISHMEARDADITVREKNWQTYLNSKVKNETEFIRIYEEVGDYVKLENQSFTKISDAFIFTTRKRNFWSRLFDPSTTLSYLAGLEMPSIIFKSSE
jgi:hypothetical protein